MEANLPETILTCTQCGGELHPDEGQVFLTCPFCSSAVYVDKSRVVFHWYLAPTLDQEKALAALRRWMAGSQTVKDLDQKASIGEVSFEYFPVWFFKERIAGGEVTQVVPAAATAISELRSLNLPAGDLRKYTQEIEAQAHAPSVPLQTAIAWRSSIPSLNKPGVSSQVLEQSLVHLPLYTVKYNFGGRTYTALVEAATGGVFANLFPAKAETPFLAIGVGTAITFLCLATFPVIGYAAEGGDGLGIGLLACSAAGLVSAPVLFGVATWIAAKI